MRSTIQIHPILFDFEILKYFKKIANYEATRYQIVCSLLQLSL
jgi:hypothetical protein